MPQLQLPIFPEGVSLINANLGFERRGATIFYVYGNLPVFQHHVDDTKSFRMIISQFYVNGSATQSEIIIRAFGVSKISVQRAVKLYRDKGVAGFFEEPRRRGPGVLSPPVLAKVQELFDNGHSVVEVAEELSLRADTLRKAAKAGKLHVPQKKMK